MTGLFSRHTVSGPVLASPGIFQLICWDVLAPREYNALETTNPSLSANNFVNVQVQPFRLAQQNQKLKGAKVGNFEYVQNPLHLGSLSGNMFDLILRNVRGSPSDVERAAESLKKSGFINYFGLQRFGHVASPTHMWGCHTQEVNLSYSAGFPCLCLLLLRAASHIAYASMKSCSNWQSLHCSKWTAELYPSSGWSKNQPTRSFVSWLTPNIEGIHMVGKVALVTFTTMSISRKGSDNCIHVPLKSVPLFNAYLHSLIKKHKILTESQAS